MANPTYSEMDQFKDDLIILEIDESKSEIVTIREVIKAYRKKAFRVHPDTSGYESTADFQALSNAYESTLKYLVKNSFKFVKLNYI